jgi:GAF domain-containing protein
MVQGGSTGNEIAFPPLPLYDQSGKPNHNNVATHTALTGKSVHIPNAYTTEEFDFSGTKKFDNETGYKSLSFLCVPLRNERGNVTGVLQLINAQNAITGEVTPFDMELMRVVESLSSLAAVALISYIREQTLRQEIEKLRIEIDQSKQAEQVAEITDTEYFQTLKEKLNDLRGRRQS